MIHHLITAFLPNQQQSNQNLRSVLLEVRGMHSNKNDNIHKNKVQEIR